MVGHPPELDCYRTPDAGLCPTSGRPDLHAQDLCGRGRTMCRTYKRRLWRFDYVRRLP